MVVSDDAFEFICSDSRIADYNEIEVYLNKRNDTCMFSFLSNRNYLKPRKSDRKIGSAALSRIKGNVCFLGTDNGLMKIVNTTTADYVLYYPGYKIKSVIYSSLGAVYISTDMGSFYSLNEGDHWTKIYFNNDNPEIIKFYEMNNYIYSLGTNGKLYSFLDFPKSNQTQAPVILQPKKDELVDKDVELKWCGINYSDSTVNCFQLQLSQSENFDNVILNKTKYYGTGFTLHNLESGKKYYWRIRKNNDEISYMWVVSQFIELSEHVLSVGAILFSLSALVTCLCSRALAKMLFVIVSASLVRTSLDCGLSAIAAQFRNLVLKAFCGGFQYLHFWGSQAYTGSFVARPLGRSVVL